MRTWRGRKIGSDSRSRSSHNTCPKRINIGKGTNIVIQGDMSVEEYLVSSSRSLCKVYFIKTMFILLYSDDKNTFSIVC